MLFVRLCSGELVYSSNETCLMYEKTEGRRLSSIRREERVSWLAVSEL